MVDAMPSAGAIAARRSEPGVCAVPRSNSVGLTMWTATEELMASRINLDLQPQSYAAVDWRATKLEFSNRAGAFERAVPQRQRFAGFAVYRATKLVRIQRGP